MQGTRDRISSVSRSNTGVSTRKRTSRRVSCAVVTLVLSSGSSAHAQVPGYTHTVPHQQAGGNSTYEFTRGVDIWEDGLVWSIHGTGAVTNDLTDSLGATFSVRSYTPQGTLTDLRTHAVSTRCTVFGGPYCPDRLWPNDLACDDPSNRRLTAGCIIGYSKAVAVGGWRTENAFDDNAFESGESSTPIPTCVEPNATHAWFYFAGIERAPSTYTFGVSNNNIVGLTPGVVTFVAANSSSSVELITVDSAPRTVEACTTQDAFNAFAPAPSQFAAGGLFSGSAEFLSDCTLPDDHTGPAYTKTAFGGTDGFVSLHDFSGRLHDEDFCTEPVLQIGSSGDDGILGISMDHTTGHIVVCGYYGDDDLKYIGDAECTPVSITLPHSGGRDLFVASFTYDENALCNCTTSQSWTLNWIRNYSTSSDEQAEGVWADVSGQVYVVGHRTAGGVSSLLHTRINAECILSGATCVSNPWGMKVLTPEEGSIKGLDICVDGLGRPVMTGVYEGNVAFPTASGYSSVTLSTGGDTDGFVARLDIDDGAFQWAYNVGGTTDDTSTDVNVCQFNSARLAHAGDFTGTADFEPGTPPSTLSANAVDGYTNVLDHTPEDSSTGVDYHITLMINHDLDPNANNTAGTQQGDWDTQVDAIADTIADATADWNDGRLSMRVVMYNAIQQFNYNNPAGASTTNPQLRERAMQWIPVVTLARLKEANWFAARLRAYTWTRDGDKDVATNDQDRGLRTCADAFGFAATDSIYPAFSGHAPYRHVLIPFWEKPGITLTSASVRQDICEVGTSNNPWIDQINGLAMRYLAPPNGPFTPANPVTREDVRDEAADSQVQINPTGSPPGIDDEKNLGMAAEVTTTSSLSPWQNSDYGVKLKRLFQRMTVCPADYNRVNGVEGAWNAGNDWSQWNLLYGPGTPYTDWNFNNDWPVNGNLNSSADGAKFEASFNAGCP